MGFKNKLKHSKTVIFKYQKTLIPIVFKGYIFFKHTFNQKKKQNRVIVINVVYYSEDKLATYLKKNFSIKYINHFFSRICCSL